MATTRSRGASVRRAPYFPDPIGLPVSHGDTVSTDLVVEGSPFRTVTGSQPSEAAARIGVLDVLRGFALFGMVLVHFNGRAPSASGLGGTFQRLIELFVETRAYTVFAILFGVGFAIQLRRSEARGDSISVRFIRRLVALLCFGLVAEFGFGYHVLVGYALMGFPLLLVRNWSTRALLVAAFFCVAITGLYRISLYSYRTMTVGIESAQAAATRTQTSYTEDFQAFVKAGQSSTFAERLPPGLAWGFGVMLDRSSSCRVAISRASSSA